MGSLVVVDVGSVVVVAVGSVVDVELVEDVLLDEVLDEDEVDVLEDELEVVEVAAVTVTGAVSSAETTVTPSPVALAELVYVPGTSEAVTRKLSETEPGSSPVAAGTSMSPVQVRSVVPLGSLVVAPVVEPGT